MSTHLQLANSTTMAILCGITILIVLLQPVIFMIVAFKRGKELNMTDQEMKEAARSSAIFSIIPSLPIIVSYLLLVPSLGRYFPWLSPGPRTPDHSGGSSTGTSAEYWSACWRTPRWPG